ncbi:hypothetical protein TanjilG_14265 [Lupinus angustifolius]|uniref:Uncharacterized protein n=1 Tax=Lupinus angustifolius TaxID=3871 RepID=A0A1J7HAC6_LUPAN|nr:hypothetical protein TanjilG_14265 [Lupinus angustifolius]
MFTELSTKKTKPSKETRRHEASSSPHREAPKVMDMRDMEYEATINSQGATAAPIRA